VSIEWITFGVGVFLTLLIFSLDQYNKQVYKKKLSKKAIKKSMDEINNIFRQSSAISTDYDENAESSYENLRLFLMKNLRRMDSYSFVMIHNSALIKLSEEEQDKIDRMLELIDWFGENYGFLSVPDSRQKYIWEHERDSLYANSSKVKKITETF